MSDTRVILAKGCFLAGTLVQTPDGAKAIETLSAGDKVISFNEKTEQHEVSTIGAIDVLTKPAYYSINNDGVKATGEHPFYTNNGIVEVQNFDSTHKLIDFNGNTVPITGYEKFEEEVTVYNLLDVVPNHNYYANDFLVHNKGCFDGNMRVSTPDGKKAIKDINVLDSVYSYNEKTKSIELAVVNEVDVLISDHYYIIVNDMGEEIKTTEEHPFYTTDGIKKVSELSTNDKLLWGRDLIEIGIESITRVDVPLKVYNLLNVVPNHNYFVEDTLVHNKGGGGCFLAGTQITTPEGTLNIEELKAGDKVISYNEKTHRKNTSTVERLDVLQANAYYTINSNIHVTGEHPFYTTNGIKEVQQLRVGDTLLTDGDDELIVSIERTDELVAIYNLINVEPNHNYYANGYLVHNKGGFSGGARSSSGGAKSSSGASSSSKSTSTSTGKKGAPSAADKSANSSSSRSTTSSSTKAGSKVTTSDGKSVQTSSKKPTNSKVNQQAGITGVDGYTPRFNNGYSAPAGSVVYYPQHSALDYLPWVYLFSQDSPAKDQATIVQPDGKEVTAQPTQEGVDGLAVFNWFLLVVIVIAVIGGIIWGVNKLTNKDSGGYY